MEEQVITETQVDIFRVLVRKQVSINYDQPVSKISLPKRVKDVHQDISKVKIKKTGEKSVNLVLIDLGPNVCHNKAKKLMADKGIEQAGVHETFHFIEFLTELSVAEKIFISSLREESRHGILELIPTICMFGKNSIIISLSPKDDLPLYRMYFLGIEN